MGRNLHSRPDLNLVQRPSHLEPREYTLYSLPLVIERLPARCVLEPPELSHHLLMAFLYLDDGYSPALTLYPVYKRPSRVAHICHDVVGAEALDVILGLTQHRLSLLVVVDVTRSDRRNYWQFVLAVYKKVKFIPKGVLLASVSALLDTPSSVLVRLHGLSAVSPSLDSRRVQSDTPPEAWEHLVVASSQTTRNAFELGQYLIGCQLAKEPRECRVVRDITFRSNPTHLGNVGVIVKGSDKVSVRRQGQDELCNIAMPKSPNAVTLRASTRRANESFNEGIIVQGFKDSFKLSDNRRNLNLDGGYGSLSVNHREVNPSCWSGSVGVSSICTPVCFVSLIVLRFRFIVNLLRHTFVTNSLRVLVCTRNNANDQNVAKPNITIAITTIVYLTAATCHHDNVGSPLVLSCGSLGAVWLTLLGVPHRSFFLPYLLLPIKNAQY